MVCIFDDQIEDFKGLVKDYDGTYSVAVLIARTVLPFTVTEANGVLRRAALDCLGNVCQTHGSLFMNEKVLKSLDQVFKDGDKDLEELVLEGFKGFLRQQENISAKAMEEKEEEAQPAPGGRLAIVHNATQEDG